MGSALHARRAVVFAEGPKRTSAEVIGELYRTIRAAAGDVTVIGCNTVSHLSAGVFDVCRIGDDTSGTEWARTRKMGVNTLAFRGAQHGAFYTADADCVGVTNAIPWALNREWFRYRFRAVARCSSSHSRRMRWAQIKNATCAPRSRPRPHRKLLGEPLDWQAFGVAKSKWKLMGEKRSYDWGAAEPG